MEGKEQMANSQRAERLIEESPEVARGPAWFGVFMNIYLWEGTSVGVTAMGPGEGGWGQGAAGALWCWLWGGMWWVMLHLQPALGVLSELVPTCGVCRGPEGQCPHLCQQGRAMGDSSHPVQGRTIRSRR